MDRYLIGRVLGEGGFGITYIGCDLRLELKVAIKEYYPVDRATRNASASLEVTNFIGPSAKSFERGKQKFLGEAQVMARLDKQQVIVNVRDFFEKNNTAYIVMEYIEGITFRELLEKKGGKIPAEELFPMVEPLFHALSIIHENGLIHRDISPDNLMLENGKIRLLDFGCAREASRGTETMTIALKHGYAPIEQYQQKGQGPWTDIYALSATIYYCLTGKVPPQALDRITEDELLLPSKLGIQLSPGIEKALLKGMKLQPNRRFASAEEMWSAIYAQPVEDSGEDAARDAATIGDTTPAGNTTPAADTASAAAPRTVMENIKTDNETEQKDDAAAQADAIQTGQESDLETVSEPGKKNDFASFVETLIGPDKKMKFIFGAGIAVVCLVVITAIWINRSAREDAVMVDGQNTGVDAPSENHVSDVPVDYSDPHIFDNAVRFTSGNEEEFQSLMEDDSVESVIMDCNNSFVNREAVITKPVLLSADTIWYPDSLTIAENGHLRVEGTLDMESRYLRVFGDVMRIYAADGGRVWLGGGFVWMEDENCLVSAPNGEISMKHGLTLPETVFEGNDVCSVTDHASLQSAIEAGGPVSIDADLTLEENVIFFAPVRISEGVTVKTMQKEFTLEGAVLINNGTLEGNLGVRNGGTVINNHVLKMAGGDGISALWVQDESAVINFGTMDVDDISRFWQNSLFMNMGDLNCCDFYLIGGHMINMGNVVVKGQELGFEIQNDSRFWNKTGGVVTVKESANMRNNSWINNAGEIVIERGGCFNNKVLINYGTFQVQSGANVDPEGAGIYYGSGQYDISEADIKVYHESLYEPEGVGETAEVTNEEELLAALEDSKITAVYVRGNISAHTDLTIRKQLFIDNGCSLTMADDAAIIDYGNAIMLEEYASLQGNNITLREDAQIYMKGNSNLIVDENGSLTLDSSIIYGWGVNIKLNGAVFLLENEAGLTFDDIDSLEVFGSEIILQNKSVFAMPPSCNTMSIRGSSITLSEEGGQSYFYTGSDMKLTDCSLCIDTGVFRNADRNLDLSNCTINVAPDGGFISELSNLSLLNETSLHNEGYVSISGWDEFKFTVHGEIENYGTMELGMSDIELSEPINNQNNFYYLGGYYRNSDREWDDAYVIGNAPIER